MKSSILPVAAPSFAKYAWFVVVGVERVLTLYKKGSCHNDFFETFG